MLFRIACFVLFFVCLTSILTFPAKAQQITSEIYETEEDLREGLESGALTLDLYLELLDLIQAKVIPTTDEADRLIFLPGVSTGDISQVKDEKKEDILLNQRTDPFLSESPKRRLGLSGKFIWRFYEEFQNEDKTDSYFKLEIANKRNFIWQMDADQKTDQDFRIRKRSLNIFYPKYSTQVIVGNFDKKIGLGLNVGYHPHFEYSSSSDLKSKDSFLYPTLGRYNGIYTESRLDFFSVLVFYSKNKRERIEDQIAAFDVNVLAKGIKMGLCVSEGKLKNIENKGTFGDDCRSLHFDWRLKSIHMSGEYALLSNKKSGRALDFYSLRKPYRVDFSWWNYDDGFVHPFGGGLSNPDYESIYLEEIDYNYRSRQAGEGGVFFKSRYTLFDRLSLNFSYTQWTERKDSPQKMKFKVGFGYSISKSFSFVVYQLWTDYDLESVGIDRKVSSVNLFLSPRKDFDLRFITNYKTREKKNYGDFQLKARTQMILPFDFTLWLKYNDSDFSKSSDGYFSFHVQEKIRFFENYFLSAEYVTKLYQDQNKVDTKAARIRLETLW
ncbi:MAG: hypothetical protein AMJ90_10205 [candidate division Zixibacteria bacterium SM23_73_2]|nr:MAG: hypothetical protein AMJ90_10205 [candidate division Zixibacteria bacterium SM23_73_2]